MRSRRSTYAVASGVHPQMARSCWYGLEAHAQTRCPQDGRLIEPQLCEQAHTTTKTKLELLNFSESPREGPHSWLSKVDFAINPTGSS